MKPEPLTRNEYEDVCASVWYVHAIRSKALLGPLSRADTEELDHAIRHLRAVEKRGHDIPSMRQAVEYQCNG